MDLSTRYLGLELPHPFMPGASPLADDLDEVKRLEDAGAAAIVMRSLFEEQISQEQVATHRYTDFHRDTFAEAASFFPEPEDFRLGPDEYLEQLRRIRQSVKIPVIASLNGTTMGGWLEHARLMEQAGASALELNVYSLATDIDESSHDVEKRLVEMVSAVSRMVRIPVAVKLSPFYSALSHLAAQLEKAGAKGLVLFNRFYQPDIDVQELAVKRTLHLSDSSELLLRLRWLAVLSAQRQLSFAATGGIHDALDAVRAGMAGAHAIQMTSALLRHGSLHLHEVRKGFAAWLEDNGYESFQQLRGNMNLARCPDPAAYERANYMLVLQSWSKGRAL